MQPLLEYSNDNKLTGSLSYPWIVSLLRHSMLSWDCLSCHYHVRVSRYALRRMKPLGLHFPRTTMPPWFPATVLQVCFLSADSTPPSPLSMAHVPWFQFTALLQWLPSSCLHYPCALAFQLHVILLLVNTALASVLPWHRCMASLPK